MGDKGETRPREGGHTIQHRHTCGETDFGRQWHMWGDKKQLENGRQWATRGDVPTQAHMWEDNPTQETCGDNGRQGETRRREGGHTIQHRHTCGETMGDNGEMGEGETRPWFKAGTPFNKAHMTTRGDKTLRRRHHPTQTHIVGRQGETRPREGGHTIQNMWGHTMWGDNGRQQAHMWGDNGRQKGKTTRREGGHTIQHRHTCGETMGDSSMGQTGGEGRRPRGRRTHHPTRHTCGETMGDKGRQGETRPSGRRTHHPTQTHMRETMGTLGEETRHSRMDKRIIQHRHTCGTRQRGEKCKDKTLGKADTPSNTGKHVGR